MTKHRILSTILSTISTYRSNPLLRAFLAGMCVILASGCSLALNPTSLDVDPVTLPGNPGSIAFDDLLYDSRLGKVIVPGAGTGKLALINPDTLDVQVVEGFSQQSSEISGSAGTTSAAVVRGLIYAIDIGAMKLNVIDPSSASIIGSAPVQATPEYVRFMAATNELWVTEPVKEQIEVFSAPTADPFTPVHVGVISVPNGPEGLVVDRSRGLAYTNQSGIGMTAVIQVQTHGILDQWGNGCSDARGLAVDEERSYLFVACNEGKIVMMDASDDGKQLASQIYGGDVHAIAYNPRLEHVYLPSGASAILAIFGVSHTASTSGTATPEASSSAGSPTPTSTLSLVRLGTVDTALNADCVTVDDKDGIWVCDPSNGRLLLARDTFPASGTAPEEPIQ